MYHHYNHWIIQYTLLGEWNKWTAVSQQRFASIVTNAEKSQTTINLQGSSAEAVQLVVYHPTLSTGIITCRIPPGSGGHAQLIITPSDVNCS